jgi:hypothetical protein
LENIYNNKNYDSDDKLAIQKLNLNRIKCKFEDYTKFF